MKRLQGENIVCVASGYWDESPLAVHRYMERLAYDNRVLFVERPVTPLSFITPGQRSQALPQFKHWLMDPIRQIKTNLYLGTPTPAFPLRFETPILKFNQRLRIIWIQKAIKTLGFESPLLWIYDPDAAPLVGQLGEKGSVYMITDDFASNPSSFNRESQIRNWEQKLVSSVDLVITSASGLRSGLSPYNKNTFYVSQGVEYEIFARTLQADLPLAEELKGISEPIIGFIGRINGRINFDLIEAICEKFPDWCLVLVGALGDDAVASKIKHHPNILCTGLKTVEQLPAYLKAISVCIIPYQINEHTMYMHPLKALEYLAGGKPVVSTPLPELMKHQSMIQFADTAANFVEAISVALRTDTEEKRKERSAYASNKTYEHQLSRITSYLLEVLA